MKQSALPLVALALFAAGESMPSDLSWLRALSEMTSFGIFVWFCWYGLTKSFPRMLKNHKEIEDGAQKMFKEECAAGREHQSDIVTRVMDRHREDIKEVTGELKNLTSKIDSCPAKRGD